MQSIFKFPDIARPVISHHQIHGGLRDLLMRQSSRFSSDKEGFDEF